MACRRGGLSNTALSTTRRSRRRRRFPVIKSHACMARGLLVRQITGQAIACDWRLFAYWAYYKHSRGSMSAFACGNLCFIRCTMLTDAFVDVCSAYIFYLLICLWFYHGMLMCIIYGLIVGRVP